MMSSQDKQTEMESFAFVSRFRFEWSNLGVGIHLAIKSATKMDTVMLQIICANMTFRGGDLKVHEE